jgi:hypothetical protein
MIFVANLVAIFVEFPRHLRRFSTKLKTKLATKLATKLKTKLATKKREMIRKLMPFGLGFIHISL